MHAARQLEQRERVAVRDDDHLMPPKIQSSNAKHYKSDTITEIKEFPGPHLMPSAPGWEQVADYALSWAVEHAGQPSPSPA